MPSATPAIEVAELEKRYGDIRAVAGISLSVPPGEVFGLLGPNGAGKTTTVEILEGYRRPDAGSVRVLGLDPIRDGARLRPRIGVMLQEGGLYPGIRPLEALRLFASYYRAPDDPEALLARVGLQDSRHQLVRRMSGGQQQRLSLALALVGRPELAFLDEPTSGMDPHGRATTWDLVRELAAAGTTVLLTTHAIDEAEHVCDRVAIVDRGAMVACGRPADLTGTASGSEIRFRARAGLDVGAIAVALGIQAHSASELGPGDYRVDAEATPERVAALAAWLRDRDVRISELHTGRLSLEEVFLRLTRESRS